jgi:hypothetical protein
MKSSFAWDGERIMNSQVSVINGKLKGEDDKFYGNLILP